MRYYKPDKEEIVKGFICEMYNDETYKWEEIVVSNPRSIRAIWHDDDIRVRYLCDEDFHELNLNISFIELGGRAVIIGFDENDEDIVEEQMQYSEDEANVIKDGKVIGKFFPYVAPIDGVLQPNLLLNKEKYIVRNRYELIKVLEK